jgi:hypothetical protein
MARVKHFEVVICAMVMIGAQMYAMQEEADCLADPSLFDHALRLPHSGSLSLPLSPLSPVESVSSENSEEDTLSPKRTRLNQNYFEETKPDKVVGFFAHQLVFQLKEDPRSNMPAQNKFVYELLCIKNGVSISCKKEVTLAFEIEENQIYVTVLCKDLDSTLLLKGSHESVVIQHAPFSPFPTIIRKILAHELICIILLDRCERPCCCACFNPVCQLNNVFLKIPTKLILLKCNHVAHVVCLAAPISDEGIGEPFLCPDPNCQILIASDDDYALS